MHAYRSTGGNGRTKLLYLFRSPTHVQIGRKSLDPEVREALEHTHPDLTFDWNGLLRDAPPPRPPRTDGRDRERGGRQSRQQKPQRSERPTPAKPELPDDDSVLGQALGAAEAARLRQRHAELSQRVRRRARTPEERDALLAALVPLDPDQWGTPDVIAERVREADRGFDAISAQLPKRRRGRRGGRSADSATPDQTASADVIIGERENTHAPINETSASAASGGDSRDDGPDDGPEPDAAGAPVPDPTAPPVHDRD
jgi:hypothetical protein